MKILILSDLHNEFSVFDPHATDADVIVLAGDIDLGGKGLSWARSCWPDRKILYVAGNHEYYFHDYQELHSRLQNEARALGIILLENDQHIADGFRFLGATLWTDFEYWGANKKSFAMEKGKEWLNDFRTIEFGNRYFTPQDSVDLNLNTLNWLEAKLAEPFEGKTVVVTHHLPSSRSVAPRFADDPVVACFASRLEHLFGKMDLWIHGHTHNSFDYILNGTRVVCNPRGYVTFLGANRAENFDFNPTLIIEI